MANNIYIIKKEQNSITIEDMLKQIKANNINTSIKFQNNSIEQVLLLHNKSITDINLDLNTIKNSKDNTVSPRVSFSNVNNISVDISQYKHCKVLFTIVSMQIPSLCYLMVNNVETPVCNSEEGYTVGTIVEVDRSFDTHIVTWDLSNDVYSYPKYDVFNVDLVGLYCGEHNTINGYYQVKIIEE